MIQRSAPAPAIDRRAFLARATVAVGATLGTGVLSEAIEAAVGALPADAAPPSPVQIFQTASALERVAVATYQAALNLAVVKESYPLVIKYVQTTLDQHVQHSQQFDAHTASLGGQVQSSADAPYQAVVNAALPAATTVLALLQLASQVETVARDTYLSAVNQLPGASSRTLLASVMGVEAQHVATLRVLTGLLQLHVPALVTLPVPVDKLPSSFAGIATPDGPFPTPAHARPLTEGARP